MNKRSLKNFSIRKLDLSSYNVHFLSKFRIWFAVPLVIILVAIIVFSVFSAVNKDPQTGMKLGIDFTGGTEMTVTVGPQLDDDATYKEYSEGIEKIIEEKYNVSVIQKVGSGESAGIVFKYQNKDDDLDTTNNALKEEVLKSQYGKNLATDDVKVKSISASSAKNLLKKALISLVVIFAVMLVYIAIRFEFWSGIAALIGLIHDVIMMIAFTIIFHIEVNTTYVAAVITIVAYSINNTIIVFDRVRESMRLAPKTGKVALDMYIEEAVNDTFTRSSVSTITTMIPVFLLGCFGVTSLKLFAWPIMFGLIAGTYSSLILAPTVYYLIRKALLERRQKKNALPAKENAKKAKDNFSDVMSQRKRNKKG